MSYRNQLNEWVSYMQKDFGSQIPKDFPMQMFNSNVSNEALYNTAMSLYTIVNTSRNSGHNLHNHGHSEKEAPEKRMYHLVPYTESNGNVYYIDRFENRVVMSMTRQPNGLFSYYGPREMMTVLGGRGELGDLLRRVEDSDFFHDKKK
ncbi:MAG: hypothetical protein NT120_00125 [Candidatus Aenigmarchaeota archaeon]|nr:hypothetical protein [Candidatus Aenigmarchaeota archaeon]